MGALVTDCMPIILCPLLSVSKLYCSGHHLRIGRERQIPLTLMRWGKSVMRLYFPVLCLGDDSEPDNVPGGSDWGRERTKHRAYF